MDRRKNFFKPKPSPSTTADTSKSSKSAATTDLTFKKDNQCTLDNILSQTNSTNCEIIWSLKCVMSGVSIRFNDDIGETFSTMFPNVNFKDFSLNRTKSMYVINHGLAPYFQTLLIDGWGSPKFTFMVLMKVLMTVLRLQKWTCMGTTLINFSKLGITDLLFLVIVRLTIS